MTDALEHGSRTQGPLTLDTAAQSLTVLAGYLEGFLEAWDRNGEPPSIAAALPDAGELRRVALVELIKIDLEYRWGEHNLPKRIDEYLEEFPELAEGGVPADLIYEEFHLRRRSGLNVDPQEYLDKFPAQARELDCLLGLDEPYQSTALVNESRKRILDGIQVGQKLDDFQLLAHLGQGAFASVYLARQESMQRLVALKVSASYGTEPQTLAQLDHDHIVRVYDLRTLTEGDLRLLYMQYVAGGTLQSVVKRLTETPPPERDGRVLLRAIDAALEDRGESRPAESSLRERMAAMTWPQAVCWIGARLAEALDYAHRRGVLHRDVKPANVLLTADGVPKLADFNISFSSKLAGATPAAYFGGSLAYMSPEQLEASNPAHDRRPESLDGRSDIYSLGVLLWELLTGERPFADEVEGGWVRILERMTERRRQGVDEATWNTVPANCPAGLVEVLRKCLAPEPADRFQTGEALARQLELCRKPHAQRLLYP
ncbi:MAG: serine/threonine-protein kinase, partial [Planctomycetaceae bacterium]